MSRYTNQENNSEMSVEEMVEATKVLQGCLPSLPLVLLFFVMFFSGASSFATFVFSQMDMAFYKTAIKTHGIVIDVRETYSRSIESRSRSSEIGTTRTEKITYKKVLSVEFLDENQKMQRGFVTEDQSSGFKVGDAIAVFYSPEDPESLKSVANKEHSKDVRIFSICAFVVFVASLLGYIGLARLLKGTSNIKRL